MMKQGSEHRRTARAALAAALALVLAGTGQAHAADPWPVDGRDTYNTRDGQRESPDGSRAQSLEKVWQRNLDSPVTGTPIIGEEGGIYVGTHAGTAYGIVRDTGVVYWARWTGGPILGSMLKVGSTVYAVANPTAGPHVVAMDAITGEIKWSRHIDGQRDADSCGSPSYSVDRNAIVVGVGACRAERQNRDTRVKGGVVAVNATTGQIKWKTVLAQQSNGAGVSTTPIVWDQGGKVFVSTGHTYSGQADPNSNSFVRLNLDTGAVDGRFQANGNDVSSNSQTDLTGRNGFSAAPFGFAARDGNVYLGAGAEDGVMYIIDPLSMAPRSKTQVTLGVGPPGITSTAAWDGTRILGVTSTPSLYFGMSPQGALSYAFPGLDVGRRGPVTHSNGLVWGTDGNGLLSIHNAADGRPIGRAQLGTPSEGGVSFHRRWAFAAVGTHGGSTGGVAAFR